MVRVVSAVFWGVRGPLVGDDPRSGEGELLKVVQGIEIRTASLDWKKKDGVYIGHPYKKYGATI